MNKKLSIFALSASMVASLMLGAVACTPEEPVDDFTGTIKVDSEVTQISVAGPYDYKFPTAVVYCEHGGIAQGREIRMSLTDPTGKYLYEKTLDNENVRFEELGAYKLTYESVGCEAVSIDIYIGTQLDVVENIKIEGKTVTWSPVENATGYGIIIDEGEETVVQGTTFTIPEGEASLLTIVAKGNITTWVDSAPVYKEILADHQIASFNNESYVDLVSNIAGLKYPVGSYAWLGKPAFENGVPGTVFTRVMNDDYRGDGSDWTNLAAIRVGIPNALDLAKGYDGIKIKLQMSVNRAGSATLELLANGKNTEWNQNPSPANVTVADGYTAAQWVELYVTNAQLAELGYKTGDTVLYLGVRNSGKATAASGYSTRVWIDAIDYYKES